MCLSESSAHFGLPETLANGRFEVTSKLGAGCFGEVYVGIDSESGEDVAIKFEDLLAGFLSQEISIYTKLQQDGPARGFARLFYSGKAEGGLRCMVMERLGPSLLQQLQACGGRFSPTTTVLVAQQAVNCLEYLHSKAIVHRDLKPENFLTGRGPRGHHVHLIDFGLATEYYNGKEHEEQKPASGFHGSFRYASCDAHRLSTQSRRSDLESLGYVLIYLARGSLPWAGIQAKDWRVKNKKILEAKEGTDPTELAGSLPDVFGDFLASVQGLGFTDPPEYDLLLDMLVQARSALAGPGGAPIEDHHVAWLDRARFDAGEVEPLPPRPEARQPDDLSHRWRATLRRQVSVLSGLSARTSSHFRARASSACPTPRRHSSRPPLRGRRGLVPFFKAGVSEDPSSKRMLAGEADQPKRWSRVCARVARVARPSAAKALFVGAPGSPVQGQTLDGTPSFGSPLVGVK